MSTGVLPVPLSMILCAALAGALGVLLLQLRRKFDGVLAAWALAAAGLILLASENAFGWRGAPHAPLFWLSVALATAAFLARFLPQRVDGGLAAALPLAGLAVAFASGDGVRALLSGPLLVYFVAVAFDALRGVEPAPAADAAETISRPPLRRPARVRGARELAIAVVAAGLAVQSAAPLLPAPPPPEEPATPEASDPVTAPETPDSVAATPTPAEPGVQSTSERAEETSGAAPAPAPSAGAEETPANPKIYRTRAGDTLRAIAARLYGRPAMLKALAKANPRIKADARLPSGREITLPVPPTRR